VFNLDVAYVAVAIHIYCKRMLQILHLFQTYIAEVLQVATLAGAGSERMRRRSPHARQAKHGVVPTYTHAEALPTCVASEVSVG